MTITRTRPKFSDIPWDVWYLDFGTPLTRVGYANSRADFSSQQIAQAVPGFRGLIANRIQATGPYSTDRYDVKVATPGRAFLQMEYASFVPPYKRVRTEVWAGWPNRSPNFRFSHMPTAGSKAENQALTRLLSKIREDQTQMSGLVSLAEARQTLRMFTRPFSSAVDLIHGHLARTSRAADDAHKKLMSKSRKQKGGKWVTTPEQKAAARRDLVDAVSSSWLETTFGLIPTISDVVDAAKSAYRWQNDRRMTRVVARGASEWSYPPTSVVSGFSSIKCRSEYTVKTEHSVVYRAGLSSEGLLASGSVGRLAELSGLTISQFVPTLWEIVPWSFLVDYFTNIGDIIEAGFTDTSKVAWVARTEKTVTTHRVVTNHLPSVSPGYGILLWTHNDAVLEVCRTTMTRSSPILGIPTLEFTHPFEQGLKVGNMVALLHQQLGKVSRKLESFR